jgi:hypothetical protein
MDNLERPLMIKEEDSLTLLLPHDVEQPEPLQSRLSLDEVAGKARIIPCHWIFGFS